MSKMPFVPKGRISEQQLSSVNATEGRTVRVYSAGVSETLSDYLNDLSARLRAQDERIAGLEREIEAFRAAERMRQNNPDNACFGPSQMAGPWWVQK